MKHKRSISGIFLFATLTLSFPCLSETLPTIGWLEDVRLHPEKLQIKAKIDTGADNSSVHAQNIHIYEKDGKKRVRFQVSNKNGESVQFDRPLVRIANIKRKGAEPLKRPVVNMDICLGNKLLQAPLNLANRENFKYRMLIGRSFLKGHFLVDSGRKFTTQPEC